jgi:8-oxo-dGTP pyrophosphatase MutT (NUDIX family)
MNSGMSSQGRGRPKASGAQRLTQYAVLAWRRPAGGPVEILLITSRETRRWVIPKGWPIKGLKPYQAAVREAWEEAGVEGRASARKIGSFDYDKRLSGGQLQPVRVEVYPLQVLQQHDDWPEAHQRERRWVSAAEAASLVDEPGLAQLLSAFPGRGG